MGKVKSSETKNTNLAWNIQKTSSLFLICSHQKSEILDENFNNYSNNILCWEWNGKMYVYLNAM